MLRGAMFVTSDIQIGNGVTSADVSPVHALEIAPIILNPFLVHSDRCLRTIKLHKY